jgi:Asp-tRNA(Asn)/Glu-tRNA(Gln) amidotransferase A subunit family amidase
VPVTTVREDETYYDPPLDQRDTISQYASKVMEGSKGLPISVCVMTGAYQDEKCLRVMRDIEQHVSFKTSCR